ncbi:MAG: c-type cytochrome [Betaproteobacteria bacterium]|nr:c-type cytochrome [Betaproteobacteria bacterium]
MKRLIAATAATLGLMLASGAHADEKLAKANGCMTCHQMDKKVLGPSYKEIAAKYQGSKTAEADLVKKVKAGSKGVWGDMIMPPNAHVKDADIQAIVKWILTQK